MRGNQKMADTTDLLPRESEGTDIIELELEDRAAQAGELERGGDGITRLYRARRAEGLYPAIEDLEVALPAVVFEKTGPRFAERSAAGRDAVLERELAAIDTN